jgi:tripeptide aminopeptidase
MIDRARLLGTFWGLVTIPSPSGEEAKVAEAITRRLEALGPSVETDEAGNLLARLAGQENNATEESLMITAHMDTVVPCDQVNPVMREGVIYSDGTSILGADDKAGVAIILEVLAVLIESKMAHRPLEILFTVSEEKGLRGAKAFDVRRLRARMAIGLDAGGPQGAIVHSAPSQDSLAVEVHGRAAHAGVNPEGGIDAIRVAAEAIAAMPLGRIDAETTANIGVISGGRATNIVPDLVTLRGEARSRNRAKLEAQSKAMRQALEKAAAAHGATLDLQVKRMYDAYDLGADTPVICLVSAAMRGLGLEPRLVPTGGGSDGNVFNAAGLQMVQISVGMEEVHTLNEYVALDDMVTAAQVVLACTRTSVADA